MKTTHRIKLRERMAHGVRRERPFYLISTHAAAAADSKPPTGRAASKMRENRPANSLPA